MGLRFVAYVLLYSEILYFFEIPYHSLATAFLGRNLSHFEKLKNLLWKAVACDWDGNSKKYRISENRSRWATHYNPICHHGPNTEEEKWGATDFRVLSLYWGITCRDVRSKAPGTFLIVFPWADIWGRLREGPWGVRMATIFFSIFLIFSI